MMVRTKIVLHSYLLSLSVFPDVQRLHLSIFFDAVLL